MPENDPLIAISFAALNRMTSRERENLRASVNGGATLYIRGGADEGVRYQLAPLLDASFIVGRATERGVLSFHPSCDDSGGAARRGESAR